MTGGMRAENPASHRTAAGRHDRPTMMWNMS